MEVEVGRWKTKVEVGGWKVEDGGGGWRLEGGDWCVEELLGGAGWAEKAHDLFFCLIFSELSWFQLLFF